MSSCAAGMIGSEARGVIALAAMKPGPTTGDGITSLPTGALTTGGDVASLAPSIARDDAGSAAGRDGRAAVCVKGPLSAPSLNVQIFGLRTPDLPDGNGGAILRETQGIPTFSYRMEAPCITLGYHQSIARATIRAGARDDDEALAWPVPDAVDMRAGVASSGSDVRGPTLTEYAPPVVDWLATADTARPGSWKRSLRCAGQQHIPSRGRQCSQREVSGGVAAKSTSPRCL